MTKWCHNKRAEKKTVYTNKQGKTKVYTNYLRHCWKCRSRRLKEVHPATYVLNMLRHSARKRKLPFTLTLAEFKAFCERTGYLERRGNKAEDLTIDRINWDDGYHINNLRVLTHAENSAQGADNRPRDQRSDADETGAQYQEPESDDQPF